MSQGGTASYTDLSAGIVVPDLVAKAVSVANDLGFVYCVRPEIGRLLSVLAGGLPAGSVVGESGTGTGAGLAWMVSSSGPEVHFVSYEIDGDQAAAARELFAEHPNVEIVEGDAAALFDHGPFDLLVNDGGPGAGKAGEKPFRPSEVLRAGGAMTIDDYSPTSEWPPLYSGEPDSSRVHWLTHDDVFATEIRVAPDLAVVLARYLPAR